jgi:hypothetical protein
VCGLVGSIPTQDHGSNCTASSPSWQQTYREVFMDAKWLVTIGSACVGALVTWQTLFATTVSEVGLFLRLVLYAVQAVLVVAIGRTRTRATN